MAINSVLNPWSKALSYPTGTSSNAAAAPSVAYSTGSSVVSISRAAMERLGASERGAEGRYDFTNISPKEMLGAINGLITSGKMSLDESSSLVALMPISTSARGASAAAMTDQPMNFFQALRGSLAFNQSTHNDAAALYDQRALAALQRLQGTPVDA